jgi:hypothetical protein
MSEDIKNHRKELAKQRKEMLAPMTYAKLEKLKKQAEIKGLG